MCERFGIPTDETGRKKARVLDGIPNLLHGRSTSPIQRMLGCFASRSQLLDENVESIFAEWAKSNEQALRDN